MPKKGTPVFGKDYMLERRALNGEHIDDWYSWESIKDELGINYSHVYSSWFNKAPCHGHWFIKKPFIGIESKMDEVEVSLNDNQTLVLESRMNFEIIL